MAKITITLIDTESGHVKVDSTPTPQKLAEIARGGDLTAAEGYALSALAKIIQDSRKNLEEEMKDKFNRGLLPAFDVNERTRLH